LGDIPLGGYYGMARPTTRNRMTVTQLLTHTPVAEQEYTMRAVSPLPFDVVVAQVHDALGEQGFGVLTEIDVRATMKAKLDVDTPAQLILGACRPQLAHQAMSAAPSIAALLPCNVVVRDTAYGTVVETIDPAAMSQLEDNPQITEVATEARTRLRAALDRIARQEA
jgi:uncharacterized protein (DUF302 family)